MERYRRRQAGWRLNLSAMAVTASASALAPTPKARSTMRASPRMSCVRLKIAAWPLRSEGMRPAVIDSHSLVAMPPRYASSPAEGILTSSFSRQNVDATPIVLTNVHI